VAGGRNLQFRETQLRTLVFLAQRRRRAGSLRHVPAAKHAVFFHGRIGLYEPRGEFQLIVDHMEDAGLGALKRQFEALSAKLKEEGLFAAERKRSLPSLPKRIGIITSPTGAAVRDILHVLARRFPAVAILIYPVSVQGVQAAPEIVAALQAAGRRAECDVLILARGGGSLEDLWAFNDERLARAIVASPIPVITGIGHEIDFTIADFAADARAPTPSAAAELVVPDAEEWLNAFDRLGARLQRDMRRRLDEHRERLRWLTGRLSQVSPTARLDAQAQRLDELEQSLVRALRRRLQEHRERLRWLTGRAALVSPSTRLAQQSLRLENLSQQLTRAWRHALDSRREKLLPLIRTLNAVSPLATLERGYAIVSVEGGEILRNAADAKPGTIIDARLAHGRLRAKVEGAS
jgi:exodeoxyribonuclease VII large subunit